MITLRHQEMLSRTFIKHQEPVGLQKLSALAGITCSSLGPFKTYKFIQDDAGGESTLAGSCLRIFENLELTCAVGQLVYETIQAHHKVYHTGTGCLLFLAGAWSRAALEGLRRGIPVAHISAAMSEGMEMCLDVCRRSSVPTGGLGAVGEASQGLGHRGKMRLSRHFCEAKSGNDSMVRQPHQPEHPNVAHVAEGLSHGCVDEMNLVVEAIRIQSENNQRDVSCSLFDVTRVMTCVLPGLPQERACVLPGCVVLLSAQQASVAHQLKGQRLKVALINGDLSESYRHLGYNRPTAIKRVSGRSVVSGPSEEEEWMEKLATLLVKLDVRLVLVSGLVGEGVVPRCCRHRILVVGKVKASVLKAFADATGAAAVTYATQLNKRCVGVGTQVEIWRDLSSLDGSPLTAVNISTGGDGLLVTAVLTSCVHAKLQALEDRFWACAYRLHHMLTDKVLLPGAGATERLCIDRLRKQAEQHVRHPRDGEEPNPYRGVVLRLMADGFIDYVATVMVNTGRFSRFLARTAVIQQLQVYDGSEGVSPRLTDTEPDAGRPPGKPRDASSVKVYDNLSVKQEAWRKALDLVLLVLQTDAEVITGIDQTSDGSQENVMLL